MTSSGSGAVCLAIVGIMKEMKAYVVVLVLALVAVGCSSRQETQSSDADCSKHTSRVDNITPPSPYSQMEWKQFDVDVEGESRKIFLKEYPQPVVIGKAIEGFKPSAQSRKSAFGTLALQFYLGSRTKTLADLETYAQLFEFPEKSMARYKGLQSRYGGWDRFITLLRKSDKEDIASVKLIGEAIVGDKHVFVTQAPGTMAFCAVLRQMPDGRYCYINDWDENIRPFLENGRLPKLFKGVKVYKGVKNEQ